MMTKAEQLQCAITSALAEAEPRRALMWKHCKQAQAEAAGAEESTVRQLAAQFAAALFAKEALYAEAKAACKCLISFCEIFSGETRERSVRLNPIRDALKAAGYAFKWNITSYSYDSLGSLMSVDVSFGVGSCRPGEDWENKRLEAAYLREQLEVLGQRDALETPAQILSKAETAAQSWVMVEAQKKAYSANIKRLRTMTKPIYFNDWGGQWRVNGY